MELLHRSLRKIRVHVDKEREAHLRLALSLLKAFKTVRT